MKTISALLLVACSGASSSSTYASPAMEAQTYELTKSYETESKGSDGSSGSSKGSDTVVERTVAVRLDGLELEYDLPRSTKPEVRARQWQMPVRIFRSNDGKVAVLNARQLSERIDRWLRSAKLTREMCGRWIFTWNAFRIDCDPQSVIETVEAFDLRGFDPREGSDYRVPGAIAASKLTKRADITTGVSYVGSMALDPGAVHRAMAEADMIVGEITGESVTLETAMAERQKENVSGEVTVTFDTRNDGTVWRRVIVTKSQTKRLNGSTETSIKSETVERKVLGGS